MKKNKSALAALAALAAAAGGVLAGEYWAYKTAFSPAKDRSKEPHFIPAGKQYQAYADRIHENVDKVLEAGFEPVTICSRDGLKLYGRYYEWEPGGAAPGKSAEGIAPDGALDGMPGKSAGGIAPDGTLDGTAPEKKEPRPLALFFHGYRSPAQRDGCGGFELMGQMGIDVLMVDQRAHGKSEGKAITLGVMEQYDCLEWLRYCEKRFGPERPILLMGISMGAATVLLASGHQLPASVRGIVADCGYSSVKKIMKQEIGKMHLPEDICWMLARRGAKNFGGFDPEEGEVAQALRRCLVPVLLIHGREDRFVPWEMSVENYESIPGDKELLTVPGAGHGMSWYLDEEGYRRAVREFCKKIFPAAEG